MIINLLFDGSALAAPQSFRDGLQTAANILEAAFNDSITVNISVGYGEVDGQTFESLGYTQDVALGAPSAQRISYTQLRSALANSGTSTDDVTSVNALPNTTSLNGQSLFLIATAEEKALGLLAANNTAIDGGIGIGTSPFWTGAPLIAAALHELTHAMGRIAGQTVLDLFRYSSAGVHLFDKQTPVSPAYLSIDGGGHKWADFGQTSDPGDFLNNGYQGPNDPFNEFVTTTPDSLTAVDRLIMDVLGFHRSDLAGPPAGDDFSDSLNDGTAPKGQITVNGATNGTLETAGDRDWFAIQLTAGPTYSVTLQGQTAGAGSLEDPYLRLYNNVGTLQLQNDDIVNGTNRDSQLSFTVNQTATYYVEAGSFNDAYTGTYQMSLASGQAPATDDFANSIADRTHPFGSLVVNSAAPLTGNLEAAGDRDWFRVQLTAGNIYTVDLQGRQSGAGTLEDPYLRIYDGNGTFLFENDDIVYTTNRDSQFAFRVNQSGTFYIEAGSFNDAYVGSYAVSIHQGQSATDDYANSLADNSHPIGSLALNGPIFGKLEALGDRDWFSVHLVTGTVYTLDLKGQHAASGTLEDPYLRLYNNVGTLQLENDDITTGTNRDSQLSFTVNQTGTYYVEAGGFNDQFTGTYTVALTSAAAATTDDFANSRADLSHSFGQLAADGSITGNLQFDGDRDWFRVRLVRGRDYDINLQGQSSGQGTLEDPYLRLHNATGMIVAENDDVQLTLNRDSHLTFHATKTGYYFIEAGAFEDSFTGSYRVSVNRTHNDDFANNLNDQTEPIGGILLKGSSTGKIEVAGDRDVFAVQLNAGLAYLLALEGKAMRGGTLATPHVRLFGIDGSLILDVNSPLENFTPQQTGTYYVDVSGLKGSAGTYTVSASHVLNGDDNDNTLIGTAENDAIVGGLGEDTLTGGGADDTFVFSKQDTPRGAPDIITDFEHGVDQIGLVGFGHIRFIGTHHFDGVKGELHFIDKGSFLLVEGDINGDRRADFRIEVHNATVLTRGDFVSLPSTAAAQQADHQVHSHTDDSGWLWGGLRGF